MVESGRDKNHLAGKGLEDRLAQSLVEMALANPQKLFLALADIIRQELSLMLIGKLESIIQNQIDELKDRLL